MNATERKATGTRQAKAPVLQLVQHHGSTDTARSTETAQALREMADMADRGEIIGLAYVILRPKRKVTAGTVGAASQDHSLVTHWLQKLNLVLLQG